MEMNRIWDALNSFEYDENLTLDEAEAQLAVVVDNMLMLTASVPDTAELIDEVDLERIDAEIAATEPYWTASELREYENWLMQMEWVYEE